MVPMLLERKKNGQEAKKKQRKGMTSKRDSCSLNRSLNI
jgi:hypothetical protein